MGKTHHYDLGDAILRIDENERDGYLTTLVQLDAPMGVVKLLEAQTHKLIDCLLEWSGEKAPAPAPSSSDAYALIADLREQLAAAHADNDLAQQEIARLTADKPKRGRPKKEAAPDADAPPVEWDTVPAEPATDQGAQADHLPGFAIGDRVEIIATKAVASVDRLFADNPRKVQVLLGGTMPKVFDVTEVRLVPSPEFDVSQSEELGDPTGLAPQGGELDVPELVAGLEAVGLTVLTEVPDVVVTDMDPDKLRAALYEDVKLYGFSADEMRDLIEEVTGLRVSSKELDARRLGAVLRAMHERGRQSRMPF